MAAGTAGTAEGQRAAEDDGPVVLVTGAGSGIGAAVARRIAGPGTRLVLHTRARRDALAGVAAEVERAGGRTVCVTGDLADAAVAPRLVQAATEGFGQLDQVVAAAGFARRGGLEATGEADMETAWQAIAQGVFRLAKHAFPALCHSAAPRFVAVSSFGAARYRADALFMSTASAKAALESLIRTLAAEYAARGIAVNAVAPGFIEKDGGHSSLSPAEWAKIAGAIPMQRLGRREEVADMIACLLGPMGGYVTGQVIRVDGGVTLG